MLGVPLAAGFGVAVLVSHLLGHPNGVRATLLFWAAVVGASVFLLVQALWRARELALLAAGMRRFRVREPLP